MLGIRMDVRYLDHCQYLDECYVADGCDVFRWMLGVRIYVSCIWMNLKYSDGC